MRECECECECVGVGKVEVECEGEGESFARWRDGRVRSAALIHRHTFDETYSASVAKDLMQLDKGKQAVIVRIPCNQVVEIAVR